LVFFKESTNLCQVKNRVKKFSFFGLPVLKRLNYLFCLKQQPFDKLRGNLKMALYVFILHHDSQYKYSVVIVLFS